MLNSTSSQQTILLGFDFGMRRIGVAVGQVITHSATPITTLTARDGIPNWEQIQVLIQQWQAEGLVVGIPYNMDGSNQDTTFAARKFKNRLHHRFRLPVHEVDERLTTKEARAQTNHQPRKKIDSYAAKLILESWLNNNAQ